MARNIERIGIIGKGKMGTNIFNYLIDYDLVTVWICKTEQDKEELENGFEKKLNKLAKRGLLSKQEYLEQKNKVVFSCRLDDAVSCDMIIECITENEKKKRKLFAALNTIVKNDCILTSNTSSISLSTLYHDCDRKHNCAGLHFFYPVQFKNIVEINTTGYCDSETIDALKCFVASINKRFLVLPEPGNFLLNKLITNVQAQAYLLYEKNILSMQQIDELVKSKLFPIGLFEFMDTVGVPIMMTSATNYTAESDNRKFCAPWIDKMKQLVEQGHSFYSYQSMNMKGPVSEDEHSEDIAWQEYKNNALDKLTCIYLNAVFNAISEQYCTESEIDYAMREYMGAEQGPIHLANKIGHENLYGMLLNHYKKTNEQIYFPSSAIKQKAELNHGKV